MARRISEDVKIDIAIAPVQATSSLTTPYFSLAKYDRALFVVAISPTDAASIVGTSILTLYQAKDASAATSAVAIASTTAILSTGTKVAEFTLTPASVSAGNTFSITGYDINGDARTELTYTATAAASAGASTGYVFNISETAAGTGIVSNVCTNVAAILNDATYGVPGLYASASSTNVTCRAVEVGENMFTLTSNNTTNMTLATTKLMGMVEINAASLTTSSNFTHVAMNIANSVSAWTSAIVIRAGRKAIMPVQRCTLDTTGE